MKKSDLKNIIKPLVKECIHEVLLQEGLLSSVISEVVAGLNTGVVRESVTEPAPLQEAKLDEEAARIKLQETRKRMLDAIGKDSYGGVDLFEGTKPLRGNAQSPHDPLANVDPHNPGVDLSKIFGNQMANNWSRIAKGTK